MSCVGCSSKLDNSIGILPCRLYEFNRTNGSGRGGVRIMKERKVPLFCWSFQRATRSNTPAIYSAVNLYLSYVSRQHGPCLVGYTLHCYIRSSNWHRSWQLVGIFLRLVTTEQKKWTERHQWRFGCILLSTLLALVSWNEPAKLQRENIQRVVKTPFPIPNIV